MLAGAFALALNMVCDSAADAASSEAGRAAQTSVQEAGHAHASAGPHVHADQHPHGHNHGTDSVTHLHAHHDGTIHLVASVIDAGKSAPDEKGGDCDCLGCWSACHFASVILAASAFALPPLGGDGYVFDLQDAAIGADQNGLVRPPRPTFIA